MRIKHVCELKFCLLSPKFILIKCYMFLKMKFICNIISILKSEMQDFIPEIVTGPKIAGNNFEIYVENL